MKIGFNLLLWTINVEDRHMPILEDLKKTGYDGVEVPVFGGDPAQFKMLGQRLSDMGLERTAVSALTSTEVNPLDADAAVRAKAVDFMKGVLDGCAALGASRVVGPMHSVLGHFSGSGPTADEKKRCVDFCRTVGEHAKSVGVVVNLEALNRFECYFVNTMADLEAHVERVGHPFIRGMYDSFHCNIEEKDPIDAIAKHVKAIDHVHISENDRGTPGRGHIDFAATFKALKAVKYDGWLTIEAFGRGLVELAAATKVWRDFFPDPKQVYQEGFTVIRDGWAKA
ncbi:sugar phosphate isomerase/epimerase family protein [Dongia sp. agr-C8]